jgi:hypothetical protein
MERQILEAKLAELSANRRYCQAMQMDDTTMDKPINELRRGLLAA